MAAGGDVEIRDLAPGEAGALVACVRRCYGETYPDAELNDAAALGEAVASGRLISKVAVMPEGRIVGHLATRLPAAGDCVAETVGGVVDPDWRGRGLLRALGGANFQVYRQLRLAGIWLFATGAHLRTQRQIVAAGGRPTGVLLGHVPAGTDYRGIGHGFGDARIGAVVFYQPLGPAPALAVELPEAWRPLLQELHERLGLERRLLRSAGAGSPGGRLHRDEARGVTWLRFGRLARGALLPVERLVEELQASSPAVAYADLPLCEPGAAALAGRLREEGFHFGALLPGSERSETLRLQRVSDDRVAPERIAVGSEEAAALRDAIVAEREELLSRRRGFGDPGR